MQGNVPSDAERQIARCQSEHPDIYDAHYDAIAQLKAIPKKWVPQQLLQSAPSATPPAHFLALAARPSPCPSAASAGLPSLFETLELGLAAHYFTGMVVINH